MPPTSPQPPIQALVQLLQSGQFDLLARQAKECTGRWPAVGPLWHLLGLAHLSAGRAGEAVAPLNRAVKLLPQEAGILEHLAIALMQSGQAREALAAFKKLLNRVPDHPNALINAASLANDQGLYPVAEGYARQAEQRHPGLAEAVYNLGRALKGQGKDAEAIATLRRAASLTTGNAVAQNDVGLQLLDLEARADAETCFRRAIALAPAFPLAHSNLGRLLQLGGKLADALAAMRRAAELAPEMAAVHANLAALLNELRLFPDAETTSRRALALDPKQPGALSNLGSALLAQGRFDEAEKAFRQALTTDPANGDARTNLGNLLLELKRHQEAEEQFRKVTDDHGYALGQAYHCAAHLCDWRQRSRDEAALKSLLRKDDSHVDPFGMLTLASPDAPELQRRAGWLAAKNHFGALLEQAPLVAPEHRPAHERLRIGYLSADFHDHATMHLLSGVLQAHDRSRFAINLYSYGPTKEDAYRRLAEENCDVFRNIRELTDDAAARQIVADEIDILVDLKGHTQDSRLGITARRPAPVISSWLGYPGTLGHARLADYLIGDPVVTPPAEAEHFTERLALLPHCYQPNDSRRPIGPPPSRQNTGLPDHGFVFCSFNQSYKFSPEVFDHWCQVLRETPDSVLWLLESSKAATANLQREAAARNVSPTRLIFAPRLPAAEHLGRLQLADLILDTAPYGSHTTGSDALWAGVPLLTCPGMTFASRVAGSLLHAVNLPELVCATWQQYTNQAVALACDPSTLATVRARLAANRANSPLFATSSFTQQLEMLYREMWSQTPASDKTPLAAS